MKRSEVNAALREMEAFCKKLLYPLPPFCAFTPEDWAHLVPIATKFSAAACQSLYNYVDADFVNGL